MRAAPRSQDVVGWSTEGGCILKPLCLLLLLLLLLVLNDAKDWNRKGVDCNCKHEAAFAAECCDLLLLSKGILVEEASSYIIMVLRLYACERST